MSDDDLVDEQISKEDRELLELLDRLGPETDAADPGYVETLGLLPYGLDRLPVRPELKQRLMASIGESEGATAPALLSSQSGRLVTLERRSRWFVPLAATLAIALLGISVLQFRQLEGQQRTIDELSAQLSRVEQNGAELAEIRQALAEKGDHLRMMTTRGAEFCVLKPVGENPRFANAVATMVIAPDRNRWFLAAEGLEPCAAGVCYQLWFITEAESIPAASFGTAGTEQRIELTGSQERVPVDVRAISITRATESASAETVLYADQAMTLL